MNTFYYGTVLIYILIIYLAVVRNGEQSAGSWVTAVLFQAATLFVVLNYGGMILNISALNFIPQELRHLIPLGIYLLVNILFIIILNAAVTANTDHGAEVEKTAISTEDIIPMDIFEEPAPAENHSESCDEVFSYIETLYKEGNVEETRKYLKMILCCSNNQVAVRKAKIWMNKLDTQEGL